MAISKILHINDCGAGFPGKHLKTAIEYITVLEKTQNGKLVSAINCQVGMAFEQMKSTKQKFNKMDKRQGYHIILSFKEGEASPDTIFELAGRFVNEYLGGKYEAVYAVHDNTDHPHAHIVFNSVSLVDGRKYRYKKGDWKHIIQPITNRLCMEYGLSTIDLYEETDKKAEVYKEWNAYRDGRFVWRDMVVRDINACILQATTYDSFISMLEDKGYEIKNAYGEGKYLSVKPYGMKRYIRLKNLENGFDENEIRRRIKSENLASAIDEKKPQLILCHVRRYKRSRITGIQKKYFARLYRMNKLKKRAYSECWKYKDEIRKMKMLQMRYLFLVDYNIKNLGDLYITEEVLTKERKSASAEKSRIYRANAKNRELYVLAGAISELLECEHAYQNGDSFFQDEHDEYMSLDGKLKSLGYTYDEVVALKEHYRTESARYKNLEQAVAKKIRMAEAIICDAYESDKQLQIDKKVISERDKQPVR